MKKLWRRWLAWRRERREEWETLVRQGGSLDMPRAGEPGGYDGGDY